MFKLTKENKNFVGFIMGISYTIYFNWTITSYSLDSVIAYSIPYLLISALIGFGISTLRKDKNYGIYFAVISLFFVVTSLS